ncbi:alpha-amylase family glycosyl hydrolase [Fulvimonas soli]|jgi:glycosidase|uniref:Glycosidase n=1 Tax=Fulvimonas soli TaxID=155197 RepID=A0A316IFS2_9GAMM|nr:alpha-amylase family glycosyl hydrolase [Fulvimonas soli]PWK92437.1 glycosidase [Fulvimonas soli]TNY26266.1 alpha-amylase [Fulvimonas soli]
MHTIRRWFAAAPAALLLALAAASAPAGDAPPPRAADEVFYQVFERSFRDSDGDRIGDLRGLTGKLDYIRDLGATSILLTPLQPSPYYHNYFATAFKAIEPAYGSLDDYFAFVRAAHARGLKVYLDEEFQYVAEGHPWWDNAICQPRAPYAGHLLWRDAQHCTAEPFLDRARWQGYDGRDIGIAMVDLHDPGVQRYFRELLLYWADPHGDGSGRDGVDGFRLDHMMDDLDRKGVDRDLFAGFWTPLFRALKARRPGLRLIAEQAGWGYGRDWLVRGHVDLVFAFPLRGALAKLDKRAIVDTLRATARDTPPGKDQIVFLENHDIDRYMSLVGGDPAKARAGAAIALLLKGEPLVYYGQELGMRGRPLKDVPVSDAIQIPMREAFRWQAELEAPGSAIWYRGDRPWWTGRYNRSHDGVSLEEEQADPDSLYHWYRTLLALRRARPELREGGQRILCDDASAVLCLLREDGARRTLLLVNLGAADARPALGAKLAGAAWADLLHGGADASPAALLHPMQVRILGTR